MGQRRLDALKAGYPLKSPSTGKVTVSKDMPKTSSAGSKTTMVTVPSAKKPLDDAYLDEHEKMALKKGTNY